MRDGESSFKFRMGVARCTPYVKKMEEDFHSDTKDKTPGALKPGPSKDAADSEASSTPPLSPIVELIYHVKISASTERLGACLVRWTVC